MDETRVIVGADVAKATVALALWQDGQVRTLGSVAQTQDGALPAVLLAALPAGVPVRLVLEPTGGYERALAAAALVAGWDVWLPNPWQVRRWAEGQGIRAKTDAVDARVLARFGATGPGRPWRPLSPAVADLAQLLAAQTDLEQTQRRLANQREAAQRATAPAAALRAYGGVQDQVAAELGALTRAIAAQLAAHPELAAARRRLLTVPGVGEKTVLPLLVLLARWAALTDGQGMGQQLTAYVGLDPRPYESGTSVHRPARISKRGDAASRTLCYQCAFGGVHGHNRLQAFYQGLRQRGKPAKLALTAASHKVLGWAWEVYRTEEDFHATLTEPAACVA